MIRCVVLDDEPLILRSIVRKIQHLNVEFKVVATAMNGLDGCRVIKEYRPDVIFTDIYMPIMNGLEVIACIQEERIQAKCVILSGYREFEFAKKALQYGVVDYLLKLIDNKKLEKLLKALMEEIGQKRLQEKKRLLESIKFGVPAPAAMTKADDLFFHAGKLVLFECKFCIGAYFADKIKPRELQQPAILDYELICRNACEENEYFLFYGTNPNEISIFFLIKAEENYKNIARQLYQAAKRQLKEGACLTCVVSHTVTSLNEVGRIEWETENTLYYGQIFSLSSFICCEEEKKKPFELPEEKFKRLKRSAREAESKDVSDIISEILDYCEENTYTQLMVRKTICRIFQCFADIQEAKADEIADTVIYSSGNYTDLKKKILERFHKGNYVENGNPDTSNADFGNEGMGESVSEDIIKKIDDYIVSHYRDTIRVQDLALKFGFNYSYLCTVFRKYKGISPNEYIIEKRVQEAEFLLKNYPEMAVKEIAEKVGYKDSLYFSRIFKKVTGYSPADYRHFAGKEGSL